MNFLFDVIIIAIIVFTVYRGVSKGFVKAFMNLISLVVAFFAAYYFTPTLATVYNEHIFSEAFCTKVSEVITSVVQKTGDAFNLEKLFNDMPESFSGLLERFGANIGELKSTYASSDATAQTLDSLAETIAEPISVSASNALAFLSIFVGALIALAILTWIIDLVFKLPILKTANKFFGFVLGCVCALVYAYIFSEFAVILINAGVAYFPEVFGANIVENSILLKCFSGFSIFNMI